MSSLIVDFGAIGEEFKSRVGGKAFVLARLSQKGLPVPPGCVLLREPQSESEWLSIRADWDSRGRPTLAVRSSAADEDSSERSFAGQHQSFLEVADWETLRSSIRECFRSVDREASRAYRERFHTESGDERPPMFVILQQMILPKFAGVYFSRDPRPLANPATGLLEIIDGLGEDLVSGKRTPVQVSPGSPLPTEAIALGWSEEMTTQALEVLDRAQRELNYEMDSEWAFDSQLRFWLLQARPITTREEGRENPVVRELRRLGCTHGPDTLFDAQTFAEWTGRTTPLSFEVWKKAFSSPGALGKALARLGYLGSRGAVSAPGQSVLDEVFGQPCVNMSAMEKLFFGATPYVMEANPRPRLRFRWKRLGLASLLNTPSGMFRMSKVAWRLSTRRKRDLAECCEALATFERRNRLPNTPGIYREWPLESLVSRWEDLAERFSNDALVVPLVLMIVIESIQQTLLGALARAYGKKDADRTLGQWMAERMRSPSYEMQLQHELACRDAKLRPLFLSQYGHRGPGELDLAKPRWAELADDAFPKAPLPAPPATSRAPACAEDPVPSGIAARLAEEEWLLLREGLELREHWKDAVLRLYAHLRWIAVEIGDRLKLGEDVFWLKPVELRALTSSSTHRTRLLAIAARRRKRQNAFQGVSLPTSFQMSALQKLATEPGSDQGQGLSEGLAYGEVRLVKDPAQVDWAHWPENAILVTEATDPGWTPLFVRSRAVVTERGGALSHCAIVAREMGLPAVSGIRGCFTRFKEGEHVWVDGTHGRITRA